MDLVNSLALLIISVTIVGVALGRYPWVRMNRATIVLVGATALVLVGAISTEQASLAIDHGTVTLLFAMMVINGNLRLSGFFLLVAARIIKRAHSARQLLALVIFSSGVLSALFLNDTICLVFTPLVIDVVVSLERNPVPYLIGLVTSANIGSAATMIGNPQNIVIGVSSHIPFAAFSLAMIPVAAVGLALCWLVVVSVYPGEFRTALKPSGLRTETLRVHRPLLFKSLLATGLMLVGLVAGAPVALASMAAASALLVTRRLKPERVFREIDWSLLVFFSGLFVVTGALETTGMTAGLFEFVRPVAEHGIAALSAVAVLLSNTISNVPAVLLFRPFIPAFPVPDQAWLTLAMATTLAGNLTLLGSVANLIVAETARCRGIRIDFGEYLKTGVPLTLLSISWGVFWLHVMYGNP